MEVSPNTLNYLVKARNHHKTGDIKGAEQAYLDALTAEPDQLLTHYELGVFYFNLQDYQKATAYLGNTVAGFSADPVVQFYFGTSSLHLKDYDNAKSSLEKALEIRPYFPSAYGELVKLGLTLERMHSTTQPPSEHLFSLPPPKLLRLQIEVTTWCNLKCVGCPRTINMDEGQWENTHIPLELFKTIIDTMPVSESLCLQGVGESTLHPEFLNMISYAKSSGKFQHLTLNTNLLARGTDYFRSLKEAGLGHISVSVDSFDADIAEACRKGTLVDKLRQRLAEVQQLFAPTKLAVSIVASKRNLHDIPATLRILNCMGAFDVEIQSLIVFDADKGEEGNASYGLETHDLDTLSDYTRGDYPNLNIMSLLGNDGPSATRCSRPFLSPYITAQGYLTPCCTIEDPSVLGFTRIDGRSFTDIWRSSPIQAWLRDYVHEAPAICSKCCFYTG